MWMYIVLVLLIFLSFSLVILSQSNWARENAPWLTGWLFYLIIGMVLGLSLGGIGMMISGLVSPMYTPPDLEAMLH